jgi:hypothetical protein
MIRGCVAKAMLVGAFASSSACGAKISVEDPYCPGPFVGVTKDEYSGELSRQGRCELDSSKRCIYAPDCLDIGLGQCKGAWGFRTGARGRRSTLLGRLSGLARVHGRRSLALDALRGRTHATSWLMGTDGFDCQKWSPPKGNLETQSTAGEEDARGSAWVPDKGVIHLLPLACCARARSEPIRTSRVAGAMGEAGTTRTERVQSGAPDREI